MTFAPTPTAAAPLVTGSLLASSLFDRVPRRRRDAVVDRHAQRFLQIWEAAHASLGPASGASAVLDAVTRPVAAWLGFSVPAVHLVRARGGISGALVSRDVRLAMVTLPWQASLDGAWASALSAGTIVSSRWCLLLNGTTLRLVDASRPWARAHADVHLPLAGRNPDAAAAVARALRAQAFSGSPCQVDAWVDSTLIEASRASAALDRGSRHAISTVARRLADVRPIVALTAGRAEPPVGRQAVTWLYRVLFLLYAEARGVVPTWHPTYRDAYALSPVCEQITRGTTPRGLAAMLDAVMRMARLGCEIDALTVTAFNGRLFDPREAPRLERLAIEDVVIADVLRQLTSQPSNARTSGARGSRLRVRFEDLGVEQLGAIYERLLDDPMVGDTTPTGQMATGVAMTEQGAPAVAADPAPRRSPRAGGPAARDPVGLRKPTGSFYTPRPLTEYLVRRTLGPLVEGAPPDRILALRVLDPAMGSGAMLVAACHFLSQAYERALVEHGSCRAGDLDASERTRIRRLVTQRSLFGVDANPMAVELARMSLWLTTLAADKPLSFLDHHLRVGNSLLGATPADLARSPNTGRAATHSRARSLFADTDPLDALRVAMPDRLRLAQLPDDSVSAVREKAQLFQALESAHSPLQRWRNALDTWCAWATWPGSEHVPPQLWRDLIAVALGRPGLLGARVHAEWNARIRDHAARHRLLHWPLAFPEVFTDREGRPREDAGFDAVIGNPPWDVVRGDGGTSRDAASMTHAFVRRAGIYSGARDAHANVYQLFVERSLQLLARNGRLGMVVPWGLLADHGAVAARTALLDRCRIDALVGFDNRRGVFAIHRSVRFALVTAAVGQRTDAVAARMGERTTDAIERIPATGRHATDFPLVFTRQALDRVSGESRAFPHVESAPDLSLLERLVDTWPALASQGGWNVAFGREFNATDDAPSFTGSPRDWPVLEGKHLGPFSVDLQATSRFVRPSIARERLSHIATAGQARLAYREVASCTNRLTLIAAILPAESATTHTLSCLRSPLDIDRQRVLCALMNSLVANWLVRRWVSTHVSTAIVHRLPMPLVVPGDRLFDELRDAADGCAHQAVGSAAWHHLQQIAARAYGLTDAEEAWIRRDFPWL